MTAPSPMIACTKCGAEREQDKLRRDALRKHGNADWCRACYRRHASSIRNSRVDPATRKRWNRFIRYRIRPEELNAMLAAQGQQCAICEVAFGERFDVDHCHASGKVRGILCHPCNVKLAHVEDAKFLAAALAYLAGAA